MQTRGNHQNLHYLINTVSILVNLSTFCTFPQIYTSTKPYIASYRRTTKPNVCHGRQRDHEQNELSEQFFMEVGLPLALSHTVNKTAIPTRPKRQKTWEKPMPWQYASTRIPPTAFGYAQAKPIVTISYNGT